MTKSLEALMARKGNAVTGSYYLVECGSCGEMFTSERMTGGEAIADTGDYGDCYCPHCGVDDAEAIDCGAVNSGAVEAWNFQQKHIDALIAALEQAQLELIKPLAIGELLRQLEDQTGEQWCGTSLPRLQPHKYRECVNELAENARKYAGAGQLRERLSYALGKYIEADHSHTRAGGTVEGSE